MQVSIGNDEPKVTAAHKACISELLLRFPCPRDTHPDAYVARANLLAKDCASLQVTLLRKACDRVSLTARGLPFASEILMAAREIVAERAEKAGAGSGPNPGEAWGNRQFPRWSGEGGREVHEAWIRSVNLYLLHHGRNIRLVLDGGTNHSKIVNLSDKVVCNGDGTVSQARWCHTERAWIFDRQEPRSWA